MRASGAPRGGPAESAAGGAVAGGGRREAHAQLRQAFGGDVPFLSASAGTDGLSASHSALANTQIALSAPAAYGFDSQHGSGSASGAYAQPGQRPLTASMLSASSASLNVNSLSSATPRSSFDHARPAAPTHAGPAAAAATVANVLSGAVSVSTGPVRRHNINLPVAAMPLSTADALLESLAAELSQLETRYHTLCDAAAAGTVDHSAASDALAALREKQRQLQTIRDTQAGTIAAPQRSPLRSPGATARRVDALRTLSHLKTMAKDQAASGLQAAHR